MKISKFVSTGHGVGASDSQSLPFKLNLSKTQISSDGDNITVTLIGTGFLTATEFRGFIIQVNSGWVYIALYTIQSLKRL